jgi:hypothetical protein
MRTLAALVSAAVVSALVGLPSTARADSMDPAIERLTLPYTPPADQALPGLSVGVAGGCTNQGRFIPNIGGGVQCRPDNVAFAKLINQFGTAIAPTAMHSGRTTGFGSFHLSFEGAFTTIDNSASYWKDGTRGPQDASNKRFSIRNNDPAGALQAYSIKIRKGFPFGFEVGAQVGTVAQTNIVTGGADVRLSLLEGFRKGALGILPDLAAGGGVRTISGTPQFNLTVASFDLQISKNLPIAESSILIPYVGYQQLWIFGDSGLVDLTPKTDPLGYCNFSGPNVPGNSDPNKFSNPSDPNGSRIYDGQPNCSGNGSAPRGVVSDFNNTTVFEKVRLQRRRLIVGLHYRYEYLYLGGQFITDIGKPKDGGGEDNSKLEGEKGQSTYVFELGAFFLATEPRARSGEQHRRRAW